MRERHSSVIVRRRTARVGMLVSLEWRPVGTNGYVSAWGAITSLCPPRGV